MKIFKLGAEIGFDRLKKDLKFAGRKTPYVSNLNINANTYALAA